MQLTQKENGLLKDMKDQEKICVEKYTKYAQDANDPQLKDLLQAIAQVEQGHLNTLGQIENGPVPQSTSSQSGVNRTFSATYSTVNDDAKQKDAYLCSDLLSTEKHVSGLYDTCIFEFKSEQVRNVLNHIQKEEQEHGKMLYDYMSVNSMY